MMPPEDTRQRLIAEGGRLFAEYGLHAVGVREICDAAGANGAAVNYHFGGKDQLYLCCVQQAGRNCLSSVPLPDWPAGTPASQRLRDFIAVMLQRVVIDRDPPWHAKLIMREMVNPTDACREFVREFVRPNFEVLSGIMAELLPNVPAPRRALFAFSVVGQVLHYRFCRPVHEMLLGPETFRSLEVELLTRHIHEFTMAALERLNAQANR